MKFVRRLHMYLGLLVFPWILLFGASGALFNHPEIGRDIEQRSLSAEELTALTGMKPWDPDDVAQKVVAQLNAGSPGGYVLDTGAPRSFSGWPLLATPSRGGGRHVLIVSLDGGGATLSTHAPEPKTDPPPFSGVTVELPEYKMAAVQEQVKELLPKVGIDAEAPFRAHPKVHPELRFRVRDANARTWNVVYDIGTGRVDGRPSGPGPLRFVELLEKLHTTHHFPVHGDMAWFFALFADLTGITLIVWALSGLAMWWQMKPTRVLGALAIAVAVAAAALVWRGTAAEVQFGNVQGDGP
ncbi:PepSY domain-containing protein [Polyangium sp. 6x1]|uniref:PepSY domain-containing protein n=1 Tax=Polyangium sp. 6x1 TaxID=3042689 RepID=UPI0032B18195